MIRRSLTTFLAAAAALVASTAAAAVPSVITHQGRLYSADGAPINDTIDVEFSIYDASDAQTPIWTETHTITFDEGYFSVGLGEMDPFDQTVFDGSVRYLGIKVGNDAEMSPRARVASVPYAILANDVNGDITPASVSIQGAGMVIDANGQWVGDPTGLVGPQGPPGADGAVGPQGPAGVDGAVGPQGPAGADGAVGPQGPPGAVGPTGAQGPQGVPGADGAVGPQGPPGADGAVGPVGPQGPAGADGAVGAQGPVGPQGPAGADGAVGAQGPAGPQGVPGATGAQGPQGPAGATGAQGPQGPAGATGAQGAQGPAGATGAQGPQGPAGATGAQGPQGPAGATGAQGPAGATGPQGATGATGVVATTSLVGPISSIAGSSAVFVFAGPTATVTVASGQRLTGSVTALLGLAGGNPNQGFDYGVCYQAGAGTVTTFQTYLTTTATSVGRSPYSATSTVAPVAGTYTVGFCVRNAGTNALSVNDWVNGYIQLTN